MFQKVFFNWNSLNTFLLKQFFIEILSEMNSVPHMNTIMSILAKYILRKGFNFISKLLSKYSEIAYFIR